MFMERETEIEHIIKDRHLSNKEQIDKAAKSVIRGKLLIHELVRPQFGITLAFFIIGCLNNFGYVIVVTSAQGLAHDFNEDDFMGIFTFILSVTNVALTILNSKWLLRIAHGSKIVWTLILATIAYLCLGVSHLVTKEGFGIALFGVLIMGVSFTIGELTMLGYLKGFETNAVYGWTAGTGLAGLFGTSINFTLKIYNIPPHLVGFAEKKQLQIFWYMIPTVFFYYLAFSYLEHERKRILEREEEGRIFGENLDSLINEHLSKETLFLVWPRVGFYLINLGVVKHSIYFERQIYIFEYLIITAFSDRATRGNENDPDVWARNTFVILTLFYQIGVVCSRSSIKFFKVKRLHILTTIQIVNCAFWGYIAKMGGTSMYIMCPFMAWVGLMGGTVYANAVYHIINDPAIPTGDKEISMNLLNVFNFLGIIFGALLSVIIENTLFQ